MFISGFVMYYTYTPVSSVADYLGYVRKKFMRLMPAFFLMGILVGAGKTAARLFIFVDNTASLSLENFIFILIKPIESYASSLWYIYVLFAYFLIMPVILFLIRGNKIVLLAIAFMIHYIPLPRYFALDRIGEYMFVFSLGICAVDYLDFYRSKLDRYGMVFLPLFALALITMPIDTNYPLAKFVIGMASIPALHWLVRTRWFSKLSVFDYLGDFTFEIYLMNTVVIGFMKGLILRFVSWDGIHFMFIAPILLLGGIWIPILIKTKVFKKIPVLDKITN